MYQCPTLKILFSIENEIERVESIVVSSAWYIEHGYDTLLPGGRKITDVSNSKVGDLIAVLRKEYDELDYQRVAHDILIQWEIFCSTWQTEIIEKTTLNFLSEYQVLLTKYGTRGSYDGETGLGLTLNIQGLKNRIIAVVIFHEIIHLAIEPLIQKYHIKHWHKERIVDLILKRLIHESHFVQKLPEEAYQVDEIFEKYFGDIEAIVKQVGLIYKM